MYLGINLTKDVRGLYKEKLQNTKEINLRWSQGQKISHVHGSAEYYEDGHITESHMQIQCHAHQISKIFFTELEQQS
jgi:hypothetical protein